MKPLARQAYRIAHLAALILWGSAASGGELTSVQVRGSTTFLPVIQRVAEAYIREQPGFPVTIAGSGSVRGYKSVMDGTADIALVDGPPPSELKRESERRGVKFVSHTIAYSAMVAVVHPSNPIASLTRDQLRHIFTGRITDWKMVGGKSGPIQVFIGTPTSGLTQAWKYVVLGEEQIFTPKATVLLSREKGRRVAGNPGAISFMVPGDADKNVRILQIDGVGARLETVLNATYPLRTEVRLVTSDKPGPATQRFVQYFSGHRSGFERAGLITADKH